MSDFGLKKNEVEQATAKARKTGKRESNKERDAKSKNKKEVEIKT